MQLVVDHVTLGASRLEMLESAFAANGMAADYGGMHSNGVTHMSLVAFEDGSYVELVSTARPGQPSPRWHEHIVHEGGPCAWALRADDVAGEAARLRARGVPVGDVIHMERSRPDGKTVAWDLAFVGDLGAGAMHPFIIKDATPRALRVPRSNSVAGSELVGVRGVVLGVADVGTAVEEFRRAYDLPAPEHARAENGRLDVAVFPGEPLILVSPRTRDGWLFERLAAFGPTPCAFLLGSRDLEATRERSRLGATESWGGLRVAWLDAGLLPGRWLGIVEA